MAKDWTKQLDDLKAALAAALGDRLVALLLYGSAARTGARPGGDVNLLLIVRDGTAKGLRRLWFDLVAERAKDDPLKVWDRALGNVRPRVEVKSRRVGGSTYQVPVDVRPDRSLALGMRWLVEYARERNEKTMQDRLASEILDAFNNRGGAVKKREDTHRMAEANKAFAHFRW